MVLAAGPSGRSGERLRRWAVRSRKEAKGVGSGRGARTPASPGDAACRFGPRGRHELQEGSDQRLTRGLDGRHLLEGPRHGPTGVRGPLRLRRAGSFLLRGPREPRGSRALLGRRWASGVLSFAAT